MHGRSFLDLANRRHHEKGKESKTKINGKGFRQFFKKDIRMANKHMKGHSASPSGKDIKTTGRYRLVPVEKATTGNKQTNERTNINPPPPPTETESAETRPCRARAPWSRGTARLPWGTVRQLRRKLDDVPREPADLSTKPDGLKSDWGRSRHTPVTAASLTTADRWLRPQRLEDERTNQLWRVQWSRIL